jgi:hypothetical protein
MSSFSIKIPLKSAEYIWNVPIDTDIENNGVMTFDQTTDTIKFTTKSIQTIDIPSLDIISLDTEYSILDNVTIPSTYILDDGKEGQIKNITAINKTTANIQTLRGTTIVSPEVSREMMYYNNQWNMINKQPDIYNWFVTVQQGNKLIGATSATGQYQGWAVALSADGNTLAIGSKGVPTTGATWIFTRSGSSWTQQGDKLVGTGNTGSSTQGFSVALSADGNTLAVGGTSDASNTGATWIFTRSNGSWTQQGNKLVGATSATGQYQGTSVALSADGNTLAVGGTGDNTNVGATWIFTRSNGVWSPQAKKVGDGYTGASLQGTSVSLSADGNTLAVGGTGDDNHVGATWIFTRTNGVWSPQGDKLLGETVVAGQYQGTSVSLSADGNTLAVGGNGDTTNTGATWIWTRSNGVWSQQGSKLVGTTSATGQYQGNSVSLSADGNTLAIGGYGDTGLIGATWIWTRTSSSWTQQGSKLVGTTSVAFQQQGYSVSLSADGNTLAIGGYGDGVENDTGATWIFI